MTARERVLNHLQVLFAPPPGGRLLAWARQAAEAYSHVGGRPPPLPPSVRFTRVTAAGVPCAWVRDEKADPDARLLYLHGGGWISGSLDSYQLITAELARLAGVSVLAVDYRLAPEHPFPAGLDDCLTAYRWLLENGPDGPAPVRRVFVGGDSAGGNLSVATLFRLREQDARLPEAAFALSPAFDLTFSVPSMESRRHSDPLFSRESLAGMARLYVQERAALTDPLVSPLYGELAGLPPMLIQVGDREVLLDDARLFAEKAQAAGVNARMEVWPEMVHVFQSFAHVLPEARQSLVKLANFIKTYR